MSSTLLRSIDAGVAILTFNRPDSANTWSPELHAAYLQALRELAVDDRVRAVVITGSGRHFCAGADISLLDAIIAGEPVPAELTAESPLDALEFPKPLIAAVNGAAAGIGLIQALLADVRFAAENAHFTTSFAQRGLVAEHGISWLLPQIVGRGVALDLLLSSRRVKADEAERIGLVHHVVREGSVVDAAVAYARTIAETCSPASIAAIKQQITRHSTLQLDEAEAETAPLVDQSLGGADFTEGVQSFMEHRPAQFPPLGSGTRLPRPGSEHTDPGAVMGRFFDATSAGDWATALGMLAPDATVVAYPGPPASGIETLAKQWQKLRDLVGPWEYLNVRRIVGERSCCEQHLVRFPELELEIEACVVTTLDEAGQIKSLEEYADGAGLRAAAKARRTEQDGE